MLQRPVNLAHSPCNYIEKKELYCPIGPRQLCQMITSPSVWIVLQQVYIFSLYSLEVIQP